MSNYFNDNSKKEHNENDKNLFSLPCDNTYSEKYITKINTKNNNFKISSLNQTEISNNISARTQILSNLNYDNNNAKEISNYICCKRHPQNIISFFCEIDKTFPCSLCISQHIDHKHSNFFCSKELFIKEINNIKKVYKDMENKYFQNKKNAENFFLNIKNHFDEQIHKINDYFDSLISILQDKKSIFISKMLIIYENYIKEFVKFKEIFDFCDQSYSNLSQKLVYIDNELFKKGDYESFYNIKDNVTNDIKNFSIYNDVNFSNNNRFNFNNNSMPCFLYPQKRIINLNDDDNLFGNFENANKYLININNINDNPNNLIKNNNDKNKSNVKSFDNLNIINNKKQNDNNFLIDSLSMNNTLKKEENNNSSLKKNLFDLESLFEKNKNKNIFSSINSNISNINDSFIEKQLIETNSTLLNKNEVKNVFKEQELDISNYNEKSEIKTHDNATISNNSNSPKFNNNICKTKFTSCNKDKRNKQIIKKFLENEDLNRNDMPDFNFKKRDINKDNSTYFNSNSNNNTYIDNRSINKTLDNENKTNPNYMKKSKQKKSKLPPNSKNKNGNITRKRSGSTIKNNKKKSKQFNSSHFDLKINQLVTKETSKDKKVNNINRYFINPSGEDKQYDNNKMSFNDKNMNQPLLRVNNSNISHKGIQNEMQSLHNSSKRKLKSNISGNKNIEIFDDKQKHNKNKRSEIANIFQIQKENNHYCYNINRSNSNRYKRK